jgi:hypothetical protein
VHAVGVRLGKGRVVVELYISVTLTA